MEMFDPAGDVEEEGSSPVEVRPAPHGLVTEPLLVEEQVVVQVLQLGSVLGSGLELGLGSGLGLGSSIPSTNSSTMHGGAS